MSFKTFLENDPFFHGSPNQFDQFSYTFVGKGNDQEGPGFYFTSKGGGSLYIVDATLPLWAV